MTPRDRQSRILALVEERGEATVDALVALFGVSHETLRRDLNELASTGVIHKVRGGARRLRLTAEGSFRDRMSDAAGAKAEIARRLASQIAKGDALFIDTGTTTLACAGALADVADLTVITNSVRIAERLGRKGTGQRVFLLGGAFAGDNGETVGPMVIEQVARFRADHAVLGAAAVDEDGAMDADPDEALVACEMKRHARRVIVVAHAEKFGRRAAFRVCRPDEIHVLVSDRAPAGPLAAALETAGVALA